MAIRSRIMLLLVAVVCNGILTANSQESSLLRNISPMDEGIIPDTTTTSSDSPTTGLDTTTTDSSTTITGSETTSMSTSPTQSQGTCTTNGAYCDNCDRFVLCINNEPTINISCSTSGQNYVCNPDLNACIEDDNAAANCGYGDRASGFRCLESGFFPDPYDCHIYHSCTSDLFDDKGTCDTPVNITGNSCSTSNDAPCDMVNVNCSKEDANPQPIENTSFYVVCLPRSDEDIYDYSVMNCPELNEFTGVKCELSCFGQNQRLPFKDCHKFLECKDMNNPSVVNCPPGTGYDPRTSICEPESSVPECKGMIYN